MKVKLPADVAHSLGQLQKTCPNMGIIQSLWIKHPNSKVKVLQSYVQENNDENFNNIMRALLDGYEKE